MTMHVGQQKRLDVLLAVARGTPVGQALVAAGYSEKVAGHKATAILSGRAYMKTAKLYAETIAGEIGETPIARELKLVQKAERWSKEVSDAIRTIAESYNEMRPEPSSNAEPAQVPAVSPPKKARRFDALMAKHNRGNLTERIIESQTPKFQEQVQKLIERGQKIDGEHLGHLGAALLEKDLVHPPKDHRSRVQIARTALEAGGKIGAAAVELHLHQTNHANLPPIVPKMLMDKMLELAGLQKAPELSASVIDAMPPEPIDGETFRATTPESLDEEARELLHRKAASQPVASSLAKLQEHTRQGAQVVLAETKTKLAEEEARR